MARMFWYAELGYPTQEIRDEVLAAFKAGIEEHAEHLTPAGWEQLPQIPEGLDESPRTVDGLPGFAWGFDVEPLGWVNTDDWATVAEIAQGPSEGGGQSTSTLP